MKKIAFVGLLAACLAGTASAEMYGVVGAGSSSLKLDCDGAPTCDKSGSAFKLFGGYKFNENFAAELGYMNFGTAKVADPTASLSIKNTGFGGGVAAFLPMSSDWTLVGRLGVARIGTKLTGRVAGASGSQTDNNVSTYVGLGVSYQISKAVSLDLATDVTKAKFNRDGLDIGSGTLRSFTLGLTVGF